MKIGVMCHSSCGGSVRIATGLCKELARRGHRLHLFSRTTPFGHWGQAEGVIIHRAEAHTEVNLHPAILGAQWPEPVLEALLSKVLGVIHQEGLDVLHYHYAVPFAYLAAEVKRRLAGKAPVLLGTLHGTDVDHYGSDAGAGPGLARALGELDGLTTVSHCHARLAAEIFGLKRPPEVIPNFVDLTKFQPVSYESRVKGAKARIVHISNFRPVKNLLATARIFIDIRRQLDAELWLLGNGPEMDQLQTVLEEAGVKQDVRFLDLRQDVERLLPGADLLLVSSVYESFCLSALEALACGVPVLAPRVGGLPEVVSHQETGFLFPPQDYGAAVAWAVNLLRDRKAHAAMRRAATARAAGFEQQRLVGLYEDLYSRLLHEKKPRQDYAQVLSARGRRGAF